MVNHGQSWSIMVNHGQKHGQKTWSKIESNVDDARVVAVSNQEEESL
jgi:hypothetical protein